MKNITLSAEPLLIERARAEARARKTTLNALFREWLREISNRDDHRRRAEAIVARMADYDSGGRFNREEMNER